MYLQSSSYDYCTHQVINNSMWILKFCLQKWRSIYAPCVILYIASSGAHTLYGCGNAVKYLYVVLVDLCHSLVSGLDLFPLYHCNQLLFQHGLCHRSRLHITRVDCMVEIPDYKGDDGSVGGVVYCSWWILYFIFHSLKFWKLQPFQRCDSWWKNLHKAVLAEYSRHDILGEQNCICH